MAIHTGQFFVILSRTLTKPVSNYVIRVGSDHPLIRKYLLLPLGRFINRTTIRMRMKNLGLGKPDTIPEISEAAAIEQASIVAETLSIAALTFFIYWISKAFTPESAKQTEFEADKKLKEELIGELKERVDRLEKRFNTFNPSLANISKMPIEEKNTKSTNEQMKKHTAVIKAEKLERVSSLPVDEASRVVLSGTEQYIVVRRDRSVCIEPLELVLLRGTPYKFRNSQSK